MIDKNTTPERHDDDALQGIFDTFEPPMASDELFMSQLQSKLASVEAVKQCNDACHRRNRRAVWVAAVAGLVAGVALTLAFPSLLAAVRGLLSSLPEGDLAAGYAVPASWVVVGAVIIGTALAAYDIAAGLRPSRQ